MNPDFSGYASKADLVCSDGLTIRPHAFKDHDGQKVPLVWQHIHSDPEMVIGHAIVEDRPDGTYVRGYFNQGAKAQASKHMLTNGDIDSMSIFARRLIKRGQDVVHGVLHEVSLVLAGANPGARIENISIQHGDGTITESIDEAIIYTGLTLEHSDKSDEGDQVSDKKTLADVYETMDSDQKALVQHLVGKLAEDEIEHSDDSEEDTEETTEDDESTDASEDENSDEENQEESEEFDDSDDDDSDEDLQHDALDKENNMTHRVFDKNPASKDVTESHNLSHAEIQAIFSDAKSRGSLKDSVLAHAEEYGITNIDVLFPDAQNITETPEFLSRRMEWVSDVLKGIKPVPFSRIKQRIADITPEAARARGYVKGNMKKDEVFALLTRETTPTTIYKKQKLDRDDIIDIDFDVVTWLKGEMRLMYDEELARAILLGDGRPSTINGEANPDKVKDPMGAAEGSGIRSIANDHSLYAEHVTLAQGLSVESTIDELVRSRTKYRGSGSPTFYTTLSFITDILLHKDKMGRRIYDSLEDVAKTLMVSKIVEVEPMEEYQNIVGIFVNLADYSVGTTRGGELNFFDDFDLDYNQEKYLYEGRQSGALSKIKAAVVVNRNMGEVVTPVGPSFNGETNQLSIPTVPGVVYQVNDVVTEAGVTTIDRDVIVTAHPAEGHSFPNGVTTEWSFVFTDEG